MELADAARRLEAWCRDKRAVLLREIELIESGKMWIGIGTDITLNKQATDDWIRKAKQRLAELNTILAD